MRPVPNQLPAHDPGAVRLALIGEAPGADEVALGQPFAGKSGWRLNQWLASAGLQRQSCFVGNVSQIRPSPTSNDFHLLEWNGGEVQEGIAALRADLAAFRPNIVVALGNAALHLLRHGNAAPPKSKLRGLFQWRSHVGTRRGSLFLAASSFDQFDALSLRSNEGRAASNNFRSPLLVNGTPPSPSAGGTPPFIPSGGPEGVSNASPSQGGQVGDPPSPFNPLGSGDNHNAHTKGGAYAHSPGNAGDSVTSITGTAATPGGGKRELTAAWKSLGTYHPAATFRDPSFTFPLVSDLRRAVAEAASPQLVLPRRDITWGWSAAEIEAKCDCIRKMREPVGFDIEGGLGGLQCCSFAVTPNDAFVIDLMGESLDRPRVLTALAAVLEDASVPKVCWNAAYERSILEAVASIRLAGYEDGMLAWWERFSELPKGLDFVASILTREPYWAEGIGWDKKTGAPRVTGPPFWTYNGIDSCVTLEIWQSPLVRAVAESRTPVAFTL